MVVVKPLNLEIALPSSQNDASQQHSLEWEKDNNSGMLSFFYSTKCSRSNKLIMRCRNVIIIRLIRKHILKITKWLSELIFLIFFHVILFPLTRSIVLTIFTCSSGNTYNFCLKNISTFLVFQKINVTIVFTSRTLFSFANLW